MLCMESTDHERREHVTVKLGKCKSPTTMVDHMQKYHKEEWVELDKTGLRQKSIKSFSVQHRPKKAQSQPAAVSSGTTHGASGIGVVERPDLSSGAVAHAASETICTCHGHLYTKGDYKGMEGEVGRGDHRNVFATWNRRIRFSLG